MLEASCLWPKVTPATGPSLGYQGAWINEIRPFYADGVSVAATAACIADARDEDGFRESQFNRGRREHGLSAAQLGVNGQ